ncbi:hypothetical protein N7481_000733 [Penicillium waksmanii]|uniref:uncharacterized protein n=1 Tax=Penicillium waksmanii TaxID=69791 RepID=UPI002548852D|nr:uncharacterized protein N7481_000733 [Penicillium waksmanii]KAJ6000324.1 hypothetical protein N7481_000733 [Penicillium waksmanii]
MTRLNLSFVAAFLVLATCAVSAPTGTKRDEGHGFGLTKALDGLEAIPKIMEGLDNKVANGKQKEAAKPPAVDNNEKTEEEAKAEEKTKEQNPTAAGNEEKVAKDPVPTPTDKNLYSGNFASATPKSSVHPTSKPNALGALPVVGGLLGGTGATL